MVSLYNSCLEAAFLSPPIFPHNVVNFKSVFVIFTMGAALTDDVVSEISTLIFLVFFLGEGADNVPVLLF